MSKYRELKINPPKIEVEKDSPREVHFNIVSCMCDNKHKITFRKKDDGQYSVGANGHALSNFQMEGDYVTDMVWAAEDGDWATVVDVINTGTSVVESVRYR